MNELAISDIPRVPLSSGNRPAAIIPNSFDGVWRLSQVILASSMAPTDFGTVEKIAVAILHGLEVGLPPMAALQSIAIINKRPSIWGDGALGLVRGSGQLEDIDEILAGEGDAMKATCIAKRAGQKPVIRSFSAADAKRAGLWGKSGPWSQYPQRMLAMRARAWALRDGFADVLKGLHIAEEVQDIPAREPRDVTPPVAPKLTNTRQEPGTGEQLRQGKAATEATPPSPTKDVRKAVDDSPPAAHQRDPAMPHAPDPSTIDETPPSPTAAKDAAKVPATADEVATILAEAEVDLSKAADLIQLNLIWDHKYEPLYDDMFPPDREDLIGVFRRHESRVSHE